MSLILSLGGKTGKSTENRTSEDLFLVGLPIEKLAALVMPRRRMASYRFCEYYLKINKRKQASALRFDTAAREMHPLFILATSSQARRDILQVNSRKQRPSAGAHDFSRVHPGRFE